MPCDAGGALPECLNVHLVAVAGDSAARPGITRPGTVERCALKPDCFAHAEGAIVSPAATARRAAASVAQQEEAEDGEEAGDDAATAPPPTTRSVH